MITVREYSIFQIFHKFFCLPKINIKSKIPIVRQTFLLMEEKPLLTAITVTESLLHMDLFSLKLQDIENGKFFNYLTNMESQDNNFENFGHDEKIVLVCSLLRSILPFLISFDDETEISRGGKTMSSSKRIHFRTNEELQETKNFVFQQKEKFDLRKLAMHLLEDCLRSKRPFGLSKIDKNLKKCRIILEYLQKYENGNDPNDEYFLTRPFSDVILKNLYIFYNFVIIRHQISAAKFTSATEKAARQLLHYSRESSKIHIEIEVFIFFSFF